MKKHKVMAIGLLTCCSLLGVGYAAWTDNLLIEQTVSTGEFNVGFVQGVLGTPNIIGSNHLVTDITPNGSELGEDLTKELDVSIENMHPNTLALYAAKIENRGTIPAQIESVDVTFNQDATDAEMLNAIQVAGGYIHLDKEGNLTKDFDVLWPVSLGEFASGIDSMLSGVILEPGESIYLDIPDSEQQKMKDQIPIYEPDKHNCLIYYMPSDVGNTLENKEAAFTITVNFKQTNM